MNFFESELKKIIGNSAILKDQKYVGRMCYGTIGGDLRARVEFVTLGVSAVDGINEEVDLNIWFGDF